MFGVPKYTVNTHAEPSPAMVARKSRTCRYSSASLASNSRAWASCALMLTPLVDEVGVHLDSGFGVCLRRLPPFCSRCRHVHH
jgi:hypothetical protein